MIHRNCLEALHRSLQDIMLDDTRHENNKTFGGKTVLLGGDFRQILPVIPSGSKHDVINASICKSPLWEHCKIFTLQTNMRLLSRSLDQTATGEIKDFATWILNVGDGCAQGIGPNVDDDTTIIKIPNDLLVSPGNNPIQTICSTIYPDFAQNFADISYLQHRAIVTPYNDTVTLINEFMLSELPGDIKTYLSCDTISKSSSSTRDEDFLYPTEFLNSLSFNGIPNHKLQLKVGATIMLLRNINQSLGLCNGTRLMVTHLASRVIQAEIISGNHIGEKVFVPRINMTVKNSKWPFVLTRKQFPIRLCYGMTINKSQGQTLDIVGLFLPKPVFTHGQLYVALSRATSREGLKILIQSENDSNIGTTKNIVYKEILHALH